jgi:hypothetical protein
MATRGNTPTLHKKNTGNSHLHNGNGKDNIFLPSKDNTPLPCKNNKGNTSLPHDNRMIDMILRHEDRMVDTILPRGNMVVDMTLLHHEDRTIDTFLPREKKTGSRLSAHSPAPDNLTP